MILTCPECATSYFVDDTKIPAAGRTVRCASCGARWRASSEPELELAQSPEEGALAREPQAPPAPSEDAKPVSELPGEALPKVFRARADTNRKVRQAAATGVVWAATAAGLAVLIALAVVFRAEVVRLWPSSAGAFATVGLPVNSLGLVIEGVRAEPALQDGRAALSISGMIRNIEDEPRVAPPLKIRLLNKSGKAVATKIARAADPRIPPGETRHFAIALLDPPSTAQDLEVAFSPEKGGTEAKAEHKGEPAAKPAAHAPKAALRGAAAPSAPVPVEAKPLPPDAPEALPHHD